MAASPAHSDKEPRALREDQATQRAAKKFLDSNVLKFLSLPEAKVHIMEIGKNLERNLIGLHFTRASLALAGENQEVEKIDGEIAKAEANLALISAQRAEIEDRIQKLGAS